MAYEIRVMPMRKRRGRREKRKRRPGSGVRFLDPWLGPPLMEERLFGGLSPRLRREVDAIASPGSAAKGTILFVEGDKPEGVFVLRSGCVKLSAGSVDGKSLVIRRAEPGEVVGLPAAISGKPYELTAEAMETIEYGFIVREAFLSFLRQHGEAALRMAEILSDTYEATLHQVRYLGLSASTAEKIARFLLELRCFEEHSNGHGTPEISLTHKEIAEMIGASRETVTRILARFKREKLISGNGSGLRILSRPGLENLLTG